MSILRYVRHACRHLIGHGARYYRDTGDFPRTLLYLAKYARHKNGHRKARQRALVAYRDSTACGSETLTGGSEQLRLAIKISGGIGDYIVIARFLRDLAASVEPFEFDIYCANESAANWVFASIRGFLKSYSEFVFDALAPSYSLALSISQFVIVHYELADWRAVRNRRRLMRMVTKLRESRGQCNFDIVVERHPYMDGYLGQKAVYMNLNRSNFLHATAGVPYCGPELDLHCNLTFPDLLGLQGQDYVTINNGFDPGFIVTGRQATKCYPHCDELVRRFKATFPGIRVVQVGTATSTPIRSADMNLIGKTTLQQAAGLLACARLHIDNEGGLVHVARSLGVRSCVIFGPTSLDYFAYPDNINIRPTFCGGCWWINSTWMDTCPRGFETARCMTTREPQDIVAAIQAAGFARAFNGAPRPDTDDPVSLVRARRLEPLVASGTTGVRS